MSVLITILTPLLQALFPSLLQYLAPSSEEGFGGHILRKRLREKIKGTWSRVGMPILLLALMGACTTHTVYVPDGTPVRLRETVKDVDVWILDATGTPTASTMDLPEGWYVLPMPEDDNIDPE